MEHYRSADKSQNIIETQKRIFSLEIALCKDLVLFAPNLFRKGCFTADFVRMRIYKEDTKAARVGGVIGELVLGQR